MEQAALLESMGQEHEKQLQEAKQQVKFLQEQERGEQ